MTRTERALAALTPFVAMAAVGLGLRVGAPDTIRTAEVFGAPAASAGTGLSWQIAAFEEGHGVRVPIADTSVAVIASAGGEQVRSLGRTNADGVAEVSLPLQTGGPIELAVIGAAAGKEGKSEELWAIGTAARPPGDIGESGAAAGPWMPFSRRTGPLMIDVAVVGQRAAPGFPAMLCVHVTSAITRAAVEDVDVTVIEDPSLAEARGGRTDSAGWATIQATPVGLALALELAVRSNDGAQGSWIGGLVAAPGGAEIRMRARFSPDEAPELEVVTTSARATEYVEVDDAHGRAWATALDFAGAPGEPRHATLRPPKLAPGLYWAIASGASDGAAAWSAGTTMRPFFVAASDDAALAMGSHPIGCSARRDAREARGALWPCLATASPRPMPRWMALDGAAAKRTTAAHARNRGLAIALAALFIASLLEATLLARVGRAARVAFAGADEPPPSGSRMSSWLVATCVALLGFALLAAFLTRVG
jgi:hypothetical protein